MDPQNELLRQTFQDIEPYGKAFIGSMYQRLLNQYPDVADFFDNTCMEEQQQKLLMFLVFVMEHLDQPDKLALTLCRLGQIHSHYQVGIEYFEKVGSAFSDTFADYLGASWTPLHQATWTQTYYQLTMMMLSGYPTLAAKLGAGDTAHVRADTGSSQISEP